MSPFSINLEKAIVPINDKIANNKIISKKKLVSTIIENKPTNEIKQTPIVSSAITRSEGFGPFTRR